MTRKTNEELIACCERFRAKHPGCGATVSETVEVVNFETSSGTTVQTKYRIYVIGKRSVDHFDTLEAAESELNRLLEPASMLARAESLEAEARNIRESLQPAEVA